MALLIATGCQNTGDTKTTQLEQRIHGLEQQLARLGGEGDVEKIARLESDMEKLKAQLTKLQGNDQGSGQGSGNGNGGTKHAGHDSTTTLAVHASWHKVPLPTAVDKGLAWLISAQGTDGGWGQDAGKTGSARTGVRLEHQGNDVANTALTALALLRAGNTPTEGKYSDQLLAAVNFVLGHIEKAPDKGLLITTRQGTQIQRKLGRYIDTFTATMLLSEVDGMMPEPKSAARVHKALEKCIAKIEANQGKDGSWNTSGGWAPIIGTSMASRGLFRAQSKGYDVDARVLDNVSNFTKNNYDRKQKAFKSSGNAGVQLYQVAQALEEASRPGANSAVGLGGGGGATAAKPDATKMEMADSAKRLLSSDRFLTGFGSMGGEEFISYMNISDSLSRHKDAKDGAWSKWNGSIKERLEKLQNKNGTWAGHHCITGRVACTSAAILTLLTERTLPRQ
ncbi:MAG: ABC transporter C-terminal domain-containing protein [Planctomycetota bacterium]|jgi:hypothetical protein